MDKQRREAEWAEAKRRCRLDAETLRMAMDLGLSPRSLLKNIPSRSQPWKAPVAVWVRELYRKRTEKAARRKAGREARAAGQDPQDDPASGRRPGAIRSAEKWKPPVRLPVPLDERLDEIARAYVDAAEAVPFGIFTTGAPLREQDLFHLAPHVFLKFRRLPEGRRKAIVEGALASYVATTSSGTAAAEAVKRSPLLAFAFCYLASHLVAGLLDEESVERTMDLCLEREQEIARRVRES